MRILHATLCGVCLCLVLPLAAKPSVQAAHK